MKPLQLLVFTWKILGLSSSGTKTLCDPRSGKHLNLSHHGLSSIPRNITPDVIVLDISRNSIDIVLNNSMDGLFRLIKLDLSLNIIQKLQPSAFNGLERLCFLNLQGNNLSMTYESFPLDVFSHVPELETLHIEDNFYPDSAIAYPDLALQNLKRLRVFYAGPSSGFQLGGGFSDLTALEEIQAQHGYAGMIGNESLAPLSATKLKRLLLVDCHILSIETGAFSHLKYLELLDLTGNQYLGLTKAMNALYGLQHHNMSVIRLRKVNSVQTAFHDTVLNETSLKYMKNICVAELDLSDNRLTYIDETFATSPKFPECFKRISFARQQFLFSKNTIRFILGIKRLKKLEYLDMSGERHHTVRRRSSEKMSPRALYGQTPSDKTMESNRTLTFYFPPSLEVLNASYLYGSGYFSESLKLENASRLRVLDMTFGGFERCDLPIFGLENLTVLNVTGGDCSRLSPDFLRSFPGLEVLVAEGLRLNTGLESDPSGLFLRHQERLTTLNMADNGLTYLHPGLYTNQRLVKSLNLGNNKFSKIPPAVRSMNLLRQLDMSFNSLISLDLEDRKWLEEMSRRNTTNTFRLSLYGNPLSCSCATLDFVLWLLHTDLHIEEKNNLVCTLENGTRTLIVNLKEQVKSMKIACVSRFWLTLSVSLSCVVVVSVCIGAISYRYRHNIKYWFLTKCRGGATYEELHEEDFRYDAFVAYNHEDYRWARSTLREFLEDVHGYSICLHHRDFPVGESIQGNIVDAINSSRRIILVISKKYLACFWGKFEIEMAGMRIVQSGRDSVVIAIMLEEIPVRVMPSALLRMWKDITFLLWANDPGEQNVFWGRLKEAMSRP